MKACPFDPGRNFGRGAATQITMGFILSGVAVVHNLVFACLLFSFVAEAQAPKQTRISACQTTQAELLQLIH